MNIFLKDLSKTHLNDFILIVTDGVAWYRSKALDILDNIELFLLSPATPEIDPVEQIWTNTALAMKSYIRWMGMAKSA